MGWRSDRWRCERCGAEEGKPCRGLRSGAVRRVEHPTRWATAVVFTLAERWLHRLGVRERLVLATRAVRVGSSTNSTLDSAPTAARLDRAPEWTDVTAALWQADLLVHAITDRVIEYADSFIDLQELRPPGEELAAAVKEAGFLLRQLSLQDVEDNPDIEPLALTEVAGPHRRWLSLSELRAARDLGQVRELVADMGRRVPPSAATTPGAQRWSVR